MNDEAFVPENPLEVALVNAMSRHIPAEDFVRIFLHSEIAIPSHTNVEGDGTGFTPVVFDKEGAQMIAVYTSLKRATYLSSQASYCLTMDGADFLKRLPAGVGVVVNPGHSKGLDISPAGITEIRHALLQG